MFQIDRISPPEMFLGKGLSKYAPNLWENTHADFIDITLQCGCSPVNLLHIFRKLFYKNTYEGLLLNNLPYACL